jgi:hypothetical protein
MNLLSLSQDFVLRRLSEISYTFIAKISERLTRRTIYLKITRRVGSNPVQGKPLSPWVRNFTLIAYLVPRTDLKVFYKPINLIIQLHYMCKELCINQIYIISLEIMFCRYEFRTSVLLMMKIILLLGFRLIKNFCTKFCCTESNKVVYVD